MVIDKAVGTKSMIFECYFRSNWLLWRANWWFKHRFHWDLKVNWWFMMIY